MLSVNVNPRRTLITGVVLLVLSLAGSLAVDAILRGVHQTEVLANVPNTFVSVSSSVLFTAQLVGGCLVAIAVAALLSRSATVDEDDVVTAKFEEDRPIGIRRSNRL